MFTILHGLMKFLFIIIFFLSSSLSATYLFIFENEELNQEKKAELFDLILQGEPPRIFYDSTPINLKEECRTRFPSICLEWIPPSIWQLGVLHSFFHHPTTCKAILACCQENWEPLQYESSLHFCLARARHLDEILECFDHHSQSLPNLCALFFQINQALVTLYQRANSSVIDMLRLIILELPPLEKWREQGFPFWQSLWIYNPSSVKIFYQSITDLDLMNELVNIEQLAHKNGQWVLYRGYSGSGYPSTLQLNASTSHALSFGSTLLGGTFFSLEAAAITYAKPENPTTHSFIALRVYPEELVNFFRIGPLHPLIQLIVDGEMFHAHTKIATKPHDSYKKFSLDGYFMKCNQKSVDSIGYITAPNLSPEELEKEFLSLCEKAGHIFHTTP